MSFYGGLQDTTKKLLKEYGQPAKIQQKKDIVNGATGSVTSKVISSTDFYVVETDSTHAFGGSLQNIDLEANYLICEGAIEISVGQEIEYGSKSYTITKSKPLNPGGVNLMYGLEVKA